MIVIRKIENLPLQIDRLVEASGAEGFSMVIRLKENWFSGKNTFSEPGEIFYGAFDGEMLVAVGGLNIDPYLNNSDTARLRHMYVLPSHRRKGIAKALVDKIIEQIDSKFSRITLRSNSKDTSADYFYERYGFQRVNDKTATHVLNLK